MVIVRPELAALPVQHLDVRSQHGEGERVERQDMLRVLGFAV